MSKKSKKPVTVKNSFHVHTKDINPNETKEGGDHWESLINGCVKAAEEALNTVPNGYSIWQRNSLSHIFASIRATHRAIRVLIKLGDTKPESVDALVLARLQLEGLYNLCLLYESPDWVTKFQHEAWMRQYTRWMLYREETKAIDRFKKKVDGEYPRLMSLMQIWGITNEQRLTIEFREMEVDPPAGFVPQPIQPFPTPGKVINAIPDGPKRQMLKRLYPEYQELCSYAHGRPIAGFGKGVFDGFLDVVPDGLRLVGDLQAHSQAEVPARWDIEFVLLQRRRGLRHYLVANDRQAVLNLLVRHEVAGIVGVAAIRTEHLLAVGDTGLGFYFEEFLAREISAFATDVSVCIDGDRKRERSCFAQ